MARQQTVRFAHLIGTGQGQIISGVQPSGYKGISTSPGYNIPYLFELALQQTTLYVVPMVKRSEQELEKLRLY